MAVLWSLFLLHFFLIVALGQEGSFIRAPTDATARSDTDAIINCDVMLNEDTLTIKEHITDPAGRIIWRSGQNGPLEQRYEISGTCSLIIRSATYVQGGRYSFELSLAQGDPMWANLIVFDEPEIRYSPLPNDRMREEEGKFVECTGFFGGPVIQNIKTSHRPIIKMTKENGGLGGAVQQEIDGQPGVRNTIIKMSYTYTPSWEDHGKDLECTISTASPAFSRSTVKTMDVEFGVRNLVIKHPGQSRVPIVVESWSSIECTADGYPDPSFTWYPVKASTPYPVPMVPIQGERLKVLGEWIGGEHEWRCEANNTVGGQNFTVEETIEFSVHKVTVRGRNGSASCTSLTSILLTFGVTTAFTLLHYGF